MALNYDEKLLKDALLFVALLENNNIEDKYANILKLIDDGSDIDARYANNKNNTPLHIATLKEEKDIVALLLDKGAGIYRNDEGKTPLDIAIELHSDIGRDIWDVLARSAKTIKSNGITKLEIPNQSKESVRLTTQSLTERSFTNDKPKLTYKKRAGTSGVTGQLYETKLLSLILFRLLNHKEMDEFYLGTNIDGIGAFDDICLRFKIQGNKKHFAVFMQAKHKDEPRKGRIHTGDLFETKNDFSLIKYFDSYIKIKEKFHPDNNDVMFKGHANEVVSNFVIYTPAMDSFAKNLNSEQNVLHKRIKDIISICDSGNIFQIKYQDDDIDFLGKTLTKERLRILGKTFINLILSDATAYEIIMNDELIRSHHIYLAQKVIELTDCDSGGHREGRFRSDFFSSNDDLLITLKEELYTEALRNVKISKETLKESLLDILSYPCESTISKLIVSVVKFDSRNNSLDFIDKNIPKDVMQYKKDLQSIRVTQDIVKNAIVLAGKERLQSMSFKLPTAFGNLEVKENESKLYMENNELGDSSNELMLCLSNSVLPAVLSDISYNDKILAKEFLNKLWFYTNQAKENEVENILKNEIIYSHNQDNQSILSIQSSAIFLRLHDDVQKWWLRPNKSHFLTNTCEFYNKAKVYAMDNPLLYVLNTMSLNKLKNKYIEFCDNSIEVLKLDHFTSGLLNIVTHVNVLSDIKLTQYFKNLHNYYFIDFNYVLSLPSNEFDILTTVLRETESDVWIISYEGKVLWEKLKLVLHEVYKKKVIIITGEVLAAELKTYFLSSYFEVRDEKNDFEDLTVTSQRTIFKEAVIIFQGEEVILGTVIDDVTKHLIKADVLSKLINNERIEIGNTLSNSNYDDNEDYYVHRYLRKGELLCKVNTLQDLKDDLIVLAANPGMGKSTLLTHLSKETKKIFPKKWIARINLLDCSRKFHEWQEKRIGFIGVKETMTLIYETVTNGNDAIKGKGSQMKFELEEVNGELFLNECNNMHGSALLQLELFINFYNNGKMIFLFDGFDEICPHYKSEALGVIQSLTMRKKSSDLCASTPVFKRKVTKNIIWITSRPYDDIKKRLEDEFGTSYCLEPLSNIEQKIYFEKYWKTNIKLHELNYEQFKNIDGFFEYMSRFCSSLDQNQKVELISLTNIPLHTMYVHAIEYFRNEIINMPQTDYTEQFKKRWNTNKEFPTLGDQYFNLARVLTFSGTPLHMFVAANYFQSEIKHHITLSSDVDEVKKKWDLDTNTFTYYERFLETKLKKIRFQDKNDMDIYKPGNKIIYEKERKEFIGKHKKLAMCAIFKQEDLKNLFCNEEFNEIRDMIKMIELGEEKTGLISGVIDNVPRFVHLVFAEYFAVEYICDMLKTTELVETRMILWDFILNILLFDNYTGVVFDHKLKNDTELMNAVSNGVNKQIVFDLWMNQSKLLTPVLYRNHVIKIKSRTSLHKALSKCLRNSAMFLISCLDGNLNYHNVDVFLYIIQTDRFFLIAALLNYDELIEIVLNKIRKFVVNPMDSALIGDDLIFCNYAYNSEEVTNEEIIRCLHLRAQMITSPHFDIMEDH